MNFLKEGKTNWKYLLIVVLLTVIVGGGILEYKWRVEKEAVEIPQVQVPKKKTFEKIEKPKVEYKNFTAGNDLGKFYVDYPSFWEPIEGGTMGIMGSPVAGWAKGESPDMCVETIEVYEGATLRLFGPKLYEGEIESYVNSISSNVISKKSEIIDSEYGKKYIWSYDFVDKEDLTGKLWAVVFDCGDVNYLLSFGCSGKEAEKDQTEIVNHVINSIRCED